MASGKICIDRKAHRRSAYTRADGTRVRATRVPGSRFCIADPGKPGVTSRGAKQGEHAGERKWIRREGDLGGPGFTSKAAVERHRLLRHSVGLHGYRSTLGKLQAILRSSTLRAKTRARLQDDVRWLEREFGGPGSFGAAKAKAKAKASKRSKPKKRASSNRAGSRGST